ncbi:MAG: bifunctional folylpolyglutamate synthase/dihydrofolate synthase [Chloroflexi bacterium]|nr:bifunctional folylpolyglutamate synthase/dihydrofolate synthase [Chloroflexota bacterium]
MTSEQQHATPASSITNRLSYTDALARVMGLADFEQRSHGHEFHLDRMFLLMERLGNPHLAAPAVHVAGTKGKGSVSAMVASVLKAQGYRTGLYTSPHMHAATERIQVSGEPVSQAGFAALVAEAWPAVEWVGANGGQGNVTTFEALTSLAFLHFKKAEVDFQVLEVGIGGRLDSTSVVNPEVAVITPISLDHVEVLGKTIAAIAREKAGIIKQGSTVVVAPQPAEALEVIEGVAAEREAKVVEVVRYYTWRCESADLKGQTLEVKGPQKDYYLRVPLLGEYQLENTATAVAVVEVLRQRGHAISDEALVEGLRTTRWPGRLEVLSAKGPLVLIDGAHNLHSATGLVAAIRNIRRMTGKTDPGRVILLFGALAGHDFEGVIGEFAKLKPVVFAVRPNHPRGRPSAEVAEAIRNAGLEVVAESESVAEATRKAIAMAGEKDTVLGAGSLSVAAEVRAEVLGIVQETYPNLKRAP